LLHQSASKTAPLVFVDFAIGGVIDKLLNALPLSLGTLIFPFLSSMDTELDVLDY
jgi:hypothetical protein